jgi:hypothetical protein
MFETMSLDNAHSQQTIKIVELERAIKRKIKHTKNNDKFIIKIK